MRLHGQQYFDVLKIKPQRFNIVLDVLSRIDQPGINQNVTFLRSNQKDTQIKHTDPIQRTDDFEGRVRRDPAGRRLGLRGRGRRKDHRTMGHEKQGSETKRGIHSAGS